MIKIKRLSDDVNALLNNYAVAPQWRGVHLYMGKIRAEIGEVLDACKELVSDSPDMMYKDFVDVYNSPDEKNIVIRSLWLLLHFYEEIKKHEEAPTFQKNNLPNDYHKVAPTFLYRLCRRVWSMLPDDERECQRIELWHIGNWDRETHIDEVSGYPLPLELPYNDVDVWYGDVESCYVLRHIFLVCLYLALKNEREWIKEQAYIDGRDLSEIEL